MTIKGSMLSLEYVLDTDSANSGKVGIRFSNNLGEFISFVYYIDTKTYELDRQNSGQVSFSSRFAKEPMRVQRFASSNLLNGQIILDTASIEIFADDGLNTFTAIFFPTEPFENVQIVGAVDGAESGKHITFRTLTITAINGIWSK